MTRPTDEQLKEVFSEPVPSKQQADSGEGDIEILRQRIFFNSGAERHVYPAWARVEAQLQKYDSLVRESEEYKKHVINWKKTLLFYRSTGDKK